MKKVEELYNYIKNNQGKAEYYGDYKIQIYSDTIQAAIFKKGTDILKIEQRDSGRLSFFMKNNQLNIISYAKGMALNLNEPLIKLYDAFGEHKDFEEVLIALLQLKNNEAPRDFLNVRI